MPPVELRLEQLRHAKRSAAHTFRSAVAAAAKAAQATELLRRANAVEEPAAVGSFGRSNNLARSLALSWRR